MVQHLMQEAIRVLKARWTYVAYTLPQESSLEKSLLANLIFSAGRAQKQVLLSGLNVWHASNSCS